MTHPRPPRPLLFGEVLFDHFPDGSRVLGGAPFNVAWHLQAFGQRPLFVSRVGDDPPGRQIRATLQDRRMDCAGLQKDSAHPTGSVEIQLQDGEPRYDILDRRAYDFITATLPPLGPCPLLYHGTLALRGAQNRATLAELIRITGAPVFVDVNLRPPWWQRDQVLQQLGGARWAKLNQDELALLAPAGGSADLTARATALQNAAGLELLVVTLGAAGALARDAGGTTARIAPAGGLPVVDTVGAGDAFAAVILLGLLRDWPLDQTLARAQELAGAVVGQRGATPENPAFYAPLQQRWNL
jgi:fructokinase